MGAFPDGSKPVVARGQGSRVWDDAGNEYIDCLIGSGALLVGHAHPDVVAAVHNQVELGSMYYALSRPAIELA
ncbi:MAG: aminotransferase class III-fold pyridoxal phosphate-dependent enzyme, partial [Anaerolineae bacterium]|nr:aminotransferase class III-fold pyridoxal phosphate-dependent enzyme [Anaerolineae bacterium]